MDLQVVRIREAGIVHGSTRYDGVEVPPVGVEPLHGCVRRAAVSGNQHAGATYDVRQSIKAGEVAREIRFIGIGVGQLDIAQHVAGDEDPAVDNLDGEMPARMGVMLM